MEFYKLVFSQKSQSSKGEMKSVMFPNLQASNDSVSMDRSFSWSNLVLTHPIYQTPCWTTGNIPA